ncbi:MAG: hypothetical protein R3F62_05755 [Planctomycetota bacterium]
MAAEAGGRAARGLAFALGCVVLGGGILAAKLLSTAPEGGPAADEARAIATLAEIGSAQVRFRAEDLDGDARYDYGTLDELCRAGLVGADLAQGTRAGYAFTCAPHPHTPEFCWWATARPERGPGRALAVNQRGAIVARELPFPVEPQAVLPADVAPVGSVSAAAVDSE